MGILNLQSEYKIMEIIEITIEYIEIG